MMHDANVREQVDEESNTQRIPDKSNLLNNTEPNLFRPFPGYGACINIAARVSTSATPATRPTPVGPARSERCDITERYAVVRSFVVSLEESEGNVAVS